VLSDIEIAQASKMKPIREIAASIGIEEDYLELYGNYKAKVQLEILDSLKDKPNGKLIDVQLLLPHHLAKEKQSQQ